MRPSITSKLSKLSRLDSLPSPIISKADIVLAVMDSMGAIVDNLAQNMEENLKDDLNDLLSKLPPKVGPGLESASLLNDLSPDKVKEAQQAVESGVDSIPSFIHDLYGQSDSEPLKVADRFQERYDALYSTETDSLDSSLEEELESQANGGEIPLIRVSFLPYVLHLLSDLSYH